MRRHDKAAGARAGIRRIALAAALVAIGAVIALPAAASASTVADCQGKIQQLRAQTETVAISGQNAEGDRAGLTSKLDEASVKLGTGKTADAVLKLEDFKAKVQQLADAGHVASTDAQSLIAGADDAIACINSLSA
jgi:hypothetical protein